MNNRIISIRKSLNLSQRELAKYLEVSKSTYARWETGEKIIPLKHLIALCNLSKTSLDYALSLTDIRKVNYKKINIDILELGKKIKEIRIYYNLTQTELAKSINTTQSVISNYENGSTIIQTSFLYDICRIYKISADYLLQKDINLYARL